MRKLKIADGQKISKMSCGQRSQVALGLILAQDPELLILDDFSMGLDPGYRKLFVDYLREYAKEENKTIFITSHIIQDLEKLIDDCIVLDYGSMLLHQPTHELLNTFRRYRFDDESNGLTDNKSFYSTETIKGNTETYSFLAKENAIQEIKQICPDCSGITVENLTLEEIFIGLTGKYS